MPWSADHLAQELNLRVRRTLWTAVETTGADLTWPALDQDLADSRVLGANVLESAATIRRDTDFLLLFHESTAGENAKRFARKLPSVAGFGVMLTHTMADFAGVPDEYRERVLTLGLDFHLAAIICDVIIDVRHQGSALLRLLPPSLLETMMATNDRDGVFARRVARVDFIELRLLGYLLDQVRKSIWQAAPSPRLALSRRLLIRAIVGAYRVQCKTALKSTRPLSMRESRSKGIAPFLVCARIVAMFGHRQYLPALQQLGIRLGILFSEIDDVVDVVEDAKSLEANVLIARHRRMESLSYENRLARILNSTELQRSAICVSDAVASIANLARVRYSIPQGQARLLTWLLASIKSWLMM